MEKRTGIILKTYFPNKRKIAVLDDHGCHEEYVPDSQDFYIGIMIDYFPPIKHRPLFIYGIEKVALPQFLAREDILFLHHVLEICYHFIPIGDTPVPQVFRFVNYLYSLTVAPALNNKKLLMVKLFALLGIIPDEQLLRKKLFVWVMTAPVDTLLDQSIDLEMERDVDIWLQRCISLHPYSENFKTSHFLALHRNI